MENIRILCCLIFFGSLFKSKCVSACGHKYPLIHLTDHELKTALFAIFMWILLKSERKSSIEKTRSAKDISSFDKPSYEPGALIVMMVSVVSKQQIIYHAHVEGERVLLLITHTE